MLVLVSFVLVLAAAVTLVVGLLQSGLTLIYLSIACSVLAGVVLAVAVLRGRPEPKAAAPIGRPYTPPASAPPAREPEPPVPASVGAPASSSAATTSFTPPPPPPPSTPAPAARAAGDDAATKAAGTALLGRLRGRRGEEPPADAAPTPVPMPEPEVATSEPVTTEMPAYSEAADDDFPIANYDQLRATDLLRQLGSLDRNQLEAVRDREIAGKNRFTILSRVDTLLAAQAEPAWELDEDEWEADAQAEVDAGAAVIAVGPIADDVDEWDDDDLTSGEIEDDEAEAVDLDEADEVDVDEVDELVSPADGPIPGYDSLTVGQILPRLSDLSPDELAQVRAREQAGRGRGTILDRIERLAARSAPAATPAAAPVRKAPAARKARRSVEAIPVPPATSTAAAVRKVSTRKAAAAAKAPAPAPAKSPGRRKAAPPIVVSPPAPAPAKRGAKKAVVVTPSPAPAKSPGRRKAAAPVVAPEETSAPTAAAVKKARAKKATKRL